MAAASTASKPEQTQEPASSSLNPTIPPAQQRLASPFLYQGPPSPNTLPGSNYYNLPQNSATVKPASAAAAAHPSVQPPLLREHSTQSTHTQGRTAATIITTATTQLTPVQGSIPSSPLMRPSRFPTQGHGSGLNYAGAYGTRMGLGKGLGDGLGQHTHARDGNSGGNADALWQQMQNTLAEVELSAMSGDHVFGRQHAQALQELRDKQLSLALAWARSEADEVVENPPADESASITSATVAGAATTSKGVVGTGGASGGGGGGGVAGGGGGTESTGKDPTAPATDKETQEKLMSEKAERDILLARKRREANDRYFDRVNSGVLDVVAKLEEVASAMRVVERESKDIWNESGDDGNDGEDGENDSNHMDGHSAVGSAAVSTATTTSRNHQRNT
ncbi:conserved hypothetical protein [Histoplasma capsulatum var. duboisii H88]|uniref:Uncharacterized protein n=1 Tax=Ajellomyces capsulatus (strain H88) TaxID=544711 RepID=F0USF0_AJEC8|nr:conserved hypothetical protein [Histoplasma capsulatum var. duboisii H88]QSS54423.1 hypothetical protein I7I53_01960 [Histoplasma capsulatum var. duboisii H88]